MTDGATRSGTGLGHRPVRTESVEVDVVLVSVGRAPQTEGVGLETTAAVVDRGFVEVDLATMMTATPGVFAVGDVVAGTPQLAHAGFAEAIAAVTFIATGTPAPVDYRAVPLVVYTHPEMAEVGYTEERARALGFEVETTSHGLTGVGRARDHRSEPGHGQDCRSEGRPDPRGFGGWSASW